MTKETLTTTTRMLAFLCRICPFCIAARRWPKSRYARALAAVEVNCPACRAYKTLQREFSSDKPQ